MESQCDCLADQGVAVAGEMPAVALGGIGLEIRDHVARIDPGNADVPQESADLVEPLYLVDVIRRQLRATLHLLDELSWNDEHHDRPATSRRNDCARSEEHTS